jgi:hypothetical protein
VDDENESRSTEIPEILHDRADRRVRRLVDAHRSALDRKEALGCPPDQRAGSDFGAGLLGLSSHTQGQLNPARPCPLKS